MTENTSRQAAKTAKQRYAEYEVDKDETSPLERLRAFCSFAMEGQDWIDVEPFFDALAAPAPAGPVPKGWDKIEADEPNQMALDALSNRTSMIARPDPKPQDQRDSEAREALDAEQIARNAVEEFKAALYRVPGFGNRVSKEVREKLTEAHCIMLNLPALLNKASIARPAPEALPVAATVPEGILDALRFYANGSHFVLHDDTAWDTVSGEPANFYEDESNTATVEDGSIAKLALQGKFFPDAEYKEPTVDGEVFTPAPEALGAAKGVELSDADICDIAVRFKSHSQADVDNGFVSFYSSNLERFARAILAAAKGDSHA